MTRTDLSSANSKQSISPELGLGDAFGRLRVSNPTTLFDSKQIVDTSQLFFDNQEVSGSGTSTSYNQNRASTTIGVSNVTAGKRVRQTFRRFNYWPAKSQLIFETFVLGENNLGIAKEVAYGDSNNGFIFKQDFDNEYYFILRSNTTGTPSDSNKINLLSGNIDPNLVSELDFSKSQILIIDFEWLGVGSVRFGFVVDGKIRYIHQFNNANNLDSVYLSTPNLPIMYSIENDGTGSADVLETICSSVISEGGNQDTGVTRFISRGTSAISINAVNVWIPLISLRLKSGHEGVTVLPISLNVVYDGTSIYEMALFINPTIAGTDAVSWVSKANSAIEYDISRDNTNLLTGGTDIAGTIVEQTNQSVTFPISLNNLLTIGQAIDGTKDELVFAIRKISGATANAYASIMWRELL